MSEQPWIKPRQNILLPLDGSTQCIDVYMPCEPEFASSASTPVSGPLYEPLRVVEIPPYVPEEDEEEQKPAEWDHYLRTSYHPRTPASNASLPTPAPSPANSAAQATSKRPKRVIRPVVVSSIVPPALLSPRARYRTKENPRSHRTLPTARPRLLSISQDSSIAGIRISRVVRTPTPSPACTPNLY
ncbi:hypothetical protein CYLTODRAFT_419737 [Cylindrobasidium torrendii FP15055 ss-10]|uniref:Uncharacterized protein n=1 Tax=Cylindrobasidium torrendii FP15055 ss-10 TaxID=1314674 RepID=A0A0D7BK74_9AGAR|nr:hypothetical protein CYLTODRAFT_419737 [Cylindrobasidium torrendii FP15055 ss-10]